MMKVEMEESIFTWESDGYVCTMTDFVIFTEPDSTSSTKVEYHLTN